MEKTELVSVVTRAQAGDRNAIEELYSSFYNSVYYFAKKTVHDDDLALDITQETFMEVIRTIGSLKAPEAFSTWLRQITYHQCTRHFRKNREVLFDEDEEGHTILDTIADESEDSIPEEVYEKAEFREIIISMVDSLSPEQRAVVILYYFDELSVKKIAEIQGVSEGTIKSRLNYARRALRDGVETYEKKTGTKLHGLAFLPLFKIFFDAPAEIAAAEATAIGEAVSAAAAAGVAGAAGAATTATAAGAAGTTAATTVAGAAAGAAGVATTATAAGAAGTTAATTVAGAAAGAAGAATTVTAAGAAAFTIPLGAKIAAAIVAVAVALGAGTAVAKIANDTPAETNAPEVEITDTADEIESPEFTESGSSDLVIPGINIPESDSEESATEDKAPIHDPTECIFSYITPTLSITNDELMINVPNPAWEMSKTNGCPFTFEVLVDGEPAYVVSDHGGIVGNWVGHSSSLLPHTTEGTHTITVKIYCISTDENSPFNHSTDTEPITVSIEYTRGADEEVETETETTEAETETAKENTDDVIQYIPTCLRTHQNPTVSIEGDILTITNHTYEFDESNRAFDDFTILIDGVDTYISGQSERVNHNGPIVNFIRVHDTASFSLAPYTAEGAHTITVKTACISADENHVCAHWKELGDVAVTLEYTRAADSTVEPETVPAVEVPTEAPSVDDLPMGDLCTKTHVAPSLSIDVDTLTITNNTEGSDDFIILIDEVIVERLFAVSGSVSLDLSDYTADGAHLVTVMSRCECDQIYYDAPTPTCDPYSSTATIVYFYGGDLPMGEACSSIHMPPTLELNGDILAITNHTWSLNESNILPDKYYILIDGEVVAGPLGVFNKPVDVNLGSYLTKEGTYTITVMSKCQYKYENGEMTNVQCDPFASSTTIEYYFDGIVEEPAIEPAETVEPITEAAPAV